MRRTSLALLAGAVAVAGLATVMTTSSVAAPGDAVDHVGDVLPGALSDWDGVSGWVSANGAGLADRGLTGDPSDGDCLTTDAAAGTIQVGDACPAGTTVGAAIGDAAGELTVALGDGQTGATLTVQDPNAPLFTAEEALSLIPPIHMTVLPVQAGDRETRYLIDVQGTGSVKRDPADPTAPINFGHDDGSCDYATDGLACVKDEPVLAQDNVQPCIVAEVRDGILGTHETDTACAPESWLNPDTGETEVYGDTTNKPQAHEGPTMLDLLNSGVVDALRDQVRWASSFRQALPVSFGYPFGGGLTNGQTATVRLDNVLANTWLGQLTTGGSVSAIDGPIDVTSTTLADVLPAGVPGQDYSSQVNLDDALWGALAPALAAQLDSPDENQGIWRRTAAGVADGVDAGLSPLQGTSPLTYINTSYANAVEFPALSDADIAAIRDGLMALTTEKVDAWHSLLQLSGPVTLSYQATGITSLTPTDITVEAPVEPESSDTPSDEPSATDTPSDEPSATDTPSDEPSASQPAPSDEPSSSQSPSWPPVTAPVFCKNAVTAAGLLSSLMASLDSSGIPASTDLLNVAESFRSAADAPDAPAGAIEPSQLVASYFQEFGDLMAEVELAGGDPALFAPDLENRLNALISDDRQQEVQDALTVLDSASSEICGLSLVPSGAEPSATPTDEPSQSAQPSDEPSQSAQPSDEPSQSAQPSDEPSATPTDEPTTSAPSSAAPGKLTLSSENWHATDTRNKLIVTVTSDAKWRVTSDAKWLKVWHKSGRSGQSFRAIATVNKGDQRTGHITVTSGTETKVLTVTQDARITLTADSTKWRVAAGTDSHTFTITTNSTTGWTAATSNSKYTWVHVDDPAGNQLTVTVDANTGRGRTGKVMVKAGSHTLMLTIVQARGK